MSDPLIEIALATYNGSHYLEELLDSLSQQSFQNWRIVARDDGSEDCTREILNTYSVNNPGKLVVLEGGCVNSGPAANFSLIMSALTSEYFMLCDQDDVWLPDKIEKSLEKMCEIEGLYGKDIPLLVHTDLIVVDENLKEISGSFFAYQNLNPANADHVNRLLVENVVTGCTLIGNRKLRELSGDLPKEAIMHDWWLALVASAFGIIGFVPQPTILYRQHGDNQEGAKRYDFKHVLTQAYNVFFRREKFKFSLQTNLPQAKVFLKRYSNCFDEETSNLLKVFCELPRQSYFRCRYNIFRYKFLITGFVRNLAFFFRV